jgi:hypothetical protein
MNASANNRVGPWPARSSRSDLFFSFYLRDLRFRLNLVSLISFKAAYRTL